MSEGFWFAIGAIAGTIGSLATTWLTAWLGRQSQYLSRLIAADSEANELLKMLRTELEVGSLFSKGEIIDSGDSFLDERSAVNAILVPRRTVPLSRKLPSLQTVEYFEQTGLGALIRAQVPERDLLPYQLVDRRTRDIVEFLNSMDIACEVDENVFGFFVLTGEDDEAEDEVVDEV